MSEKYRSFLFRSVPFSSPGGVDMKFSNHEKKREKKHVQEPSMKPKEAERSSLVAPAESAETKREF